MGYDAYVSCNCYRNNKLLSDPPYKEHVYQDEDGVWLDLDWETNKEKHSEFDDWLENKACEHSGMAVLWCRLANISGMGAFRSLIADLGNARYPILSEFLPTSNGGILPANLVEGMKLELNQLEKEESKEELFELRELSTNERIQSTNIKYDKVFIYTAYNKFNFGIKSNKMYVVENLKILGKEYSKLVFQSHSFRQVKLSEKEYRLIDNDSKEEFMSPVSIYPEADSKATDFEFVVNKVSASLADEYAYIIEPLKELAEVSLLTGNPINWA
ncbi:MAG: hypothetical protein NXI20_03525 [bacterium]|nr:hypothetical protein [bacterium]